MFCRCSQALATSTWDRVALIFMVARSGFADYGWQMAEKLPLFPLGTVLFPGLVLPLHIFEERYRRLVRGLLGESGPDEFGVVAIRKGRETGIDGVSSLYEVGCTATLRQVDSRDDGRFDLVTLGTQRFRLLGLDDSLPSL